MIDVNLLIIGPPGAGKGTQAKKIATRFDLAQIAPGELMRRALNHGEELGLRARQYMEKGVLVPDEIIVKLMEHRLQQPDAAQGVIFDGFPRNLAQSRSLDGILKRQNKTLNGALFIDVPDDVVVERLSGRLLCKQCEKAYHLKFKPPKQDGTCDRCDGFLYHREDDNPETIRERLHTFHAGMDQLIVDYGQRGLIRRVDGNQEIEDVYQNLVKAVKDVAGSAMERA